MEEGRHGREGGMLLPPVLALGGQVGSRLQEGEEDRVEATGMSPFRFLQEAEVKVPADNLSVDVQLGRMSEWGSQERRGGLRRR